jgi:hypothetical protein
MPRPQPDAAVSSTRQQQRHARRAHCRQQPQQNQGPCYFVTLVTWLATGCDQALP